MTDNSGALSIDFLVGFTIFILAFIWVATMIPNLFLGLSTHTIDYDAVAYRTGVILAEDSGATSAFVTNGNPWEAQIDNKSVGRFGLAISKNAPNILDEQKVNRFFNTTMYIYPGDYRDKAVFGDYPYQVNISLKITGEDGVRTVGDIIPEQHSYGYIRRDVKIKGWSNATVNATPPFLNQACVTYSQYSIMIDSNELLFGKVRDPAYQIIPQNERIMINITNLTGSLDPYWTSCPDPSCGVPHCNLTKIQVYQRYYGSSALNEMPQASYRNFTYEDGNTTPVDYLPVKLKGDFRDLSNVSLIFERRTFSDIDETSAVFINLTFDIYPPQPYVNNTKTQPFNYTYTTKGVIPPSLKDGVLEVAVW